ncbi:MAG: hypothetical protein M3Q78_08870, partial [Acidobacteriota bacterium]|nr:hypothetical protein [Acidobacteriota bacterium]
MSKRAEIKNQQNKKELPRRCVVAPSFLSKILAICASVLLFCFAVFPQNKYEDRQISNIEIAFEGTDRDVSAAEQFRLVARTALGETYSAVKVRDALQSLYETEQIVSASVVASENGQNGVNVRFIIKRKTKAEKVTIQIGNTVGKSVTEQQLLLRLNLLNPGTSITDQTLRNNADLILEYLRSRGYFKAEVTYTQQP